MDSDFAEAKKFRGGNAQAHTKEAQLISETPRRRSVQHISNEQLASIGFLMKYSDL
jgi:hypothetical protein